MRILLAVALLGGCALPNPTRMERLDDIPEAMVAQLDAMPVLQDDRVPRVSIEEVEGVSCRRAWKGMPASWNDAVRRTKYRALARQAGALFTPKSRASSGRARPMIV